MGHHAQIFGIGVGLQLLTIGIAGAAELPVKAPPPASVLAWSGFYLGGNIGYGWSQKTFIDNFSTRIGAVDAKNPSGVVGGLQAGYNYQINSWLIGIEGNFDWSGAKSSFSCFPLLASQTCTANPRWVAAITGRVGAIVGQSMFYVRGGAAWVHDSYTNIALTGAPKPALPGDLFTAEDTRAGWVVGLGIEYMFRPNWSANIEYDYHGFPQKSVGFDDGSGNSFAELIKQNIQTVTVGVNYHFAVPAAAPAPYVTKTAGLSSNDNESTSKVLAYWAVDVAKHSVSGWAGALIAPWGDLDKSGLRVWFYGEAGGYTYSDSDTTFKGRFESGDVLVGYGWEGEHYSINTLLGANAVNHTVTPFDPTNPVQGTQAGLKLRGDVYLTPTAQSMTYGEAEYSTAFNTYYVKEKVGFDITNGKEIYIGPQVSMQGDQRYNQWRVGGHISNMKFGSKVHVDVSVGYERDSDVGPGAYGTVEMSMNF
jgi:outer membrane immunogenic protein